jgi:integral membrane protein
MSSRVAGPQREKAHGALRRYRWMALVTGVTLLVFSVEMILKYVVGAFVDVTGVLRYLGWIPFVHGWVYVVYLVTVFALWTHMRWGAGRLAAMAVAGAVPGLSFVLERKVRAEAEAQLAVD